MDTEAKAAIALQDFTAEQIVSHYDRWLASMTACRGTKKELAQEAIDRLYLSNQLERPAIFWCQSFYQMLTMPSLIIGVLHSDIWELIAGSSTAESSARQWSRYWSKVWPEIWLNAGMPLLTGMNRTSRVAAHYGNLEGALISRIKCELGQAVHNGRLDYLQRKLKREFYRLYWARHDIADDFAKQHWIHVKHDIYDQLIYLRNRTFDWEGWRELLPLDAQVHELGDGINSLFRSLANRLGAEPWAQAGFILGLPCGLPWLATAELTLKTWPDEFAEVSNNLNIWLDLAKSCSGIVCLDGICFVCEKPESFNLTEHRRLHHANQPALRFSDGFCEYAWEGVLVPSFVIEQPDSISIERIERCDNAEVRRVMLERYGIARYIVDADIEPVQTDEYGTLYRKELRGDEPLVMVKVMNATPEPDGTHKEYFLRVPPDLASAKEAVAWTFELRAHDYKPAVET